MSIYEEIKKEEISAWLQQFEEDEQQYISKLLNNFVYYNSDRVRKVVKNLHNSIINSCNSKINDIWFVPVGYVTKSGSVIAYYYRSVNELQEEKFISSKDISRIINKTNIAIVFIDDYIGTGHQSKQVWEFVIKPVIGQFSESEFFYCTLVGTNEGVEFVRSNTGFNVVVDKVIHKEELPFVESSRIFTDVDERKKAEKIVRKYGELLYPGNELGYKDSQGLVGFFYSTPNNTLPIFWSTNEKWHPLLPRNESFRDPNNLIGVISGLNNSLDEYKSDTISNEFAELEKYDASEEFVTKGINEFQKLPNILALIQPVKKIGYEDEVFLKIIDWIGKLKRNVVEKDAVKSNLLLINRADTINKIGNLYIKVDNIKITDYQKVTSLVRMIHSYNNALVIDKDGNVLGLISLFNKGSINPYLPYSFKNVLYATEITDSMAILCNGDDRISIISSGERILLYRGASWHLSNSKYNHIVGRLSRQYDIDLELLKKIFSVIFQMSYIGKGALITIGDSDKVKRYSESPAANFARNLNIRVADLSVDSIIGIVEQDGATIINDEGTLEQSMTFLRPPNDAPGKIEMNRGSKHSTASRISAITQALVIAVSVDGRISLYKNGDIVYKIMG